MPVPTAFAACLQASSAAVAALLELHGALLVNNPAIAAEQPVQPQRPADGSAGTGNAADEAWQALERASAEIAPFRDASLDRWHRKALLSSGSAALKGQLRLLNQSLSSQVGSEALIPQDSLSVDLSILFTVLPRAF